MQRSVCPPSHPKTAIRGQGSCIDAYGQLILVGMFPKLVQISSPQENYSALAYHAL